MLVATLTPGECNSSHLLRFILCSRYPAVANKVNTDTIKEERIIEENKGMTANEQVEQIIVSQVG